MVMAVLLEDLAGNFLKLKKACLGVGIALIGIIAVQLTNNTTFQNILSQHILKR
jgi:hypothetical protein